ncbi:hypothetical protein, partial [Methanoculleus sp.]|uniref:hypothetical protein n=1 Tax=Methanoculleus sp. TaxID=90427 RepID=UPI001BD548A6
RAGGPEFEHRQVGVATGRRAGVRAPSGGSCDGPEGRSSSTVRWELRLAGGQELEHRQVGVATDRTRWSERALFPAPFGCST